MTTLITGGFGAIGLALARRLVARGERPVLLDMRTDPQRLQGLHGAVEMVAADVADLAELQAAIRDHRVSAIVHLAGMLSAACEERPMAGFRANVLGTQHVFEAARLAGVGRVVFASSVGTFGRSAVGEVGDGTVQQPAMAYGCHKLYGEHIARWYRGRGLDVRGIRYPQVAGPGIRSTWHWAPPMIDDALAGNAHRCAMGRGAYASLMSVQDAARATDELLAAAPERIASVHYNVCGVPGLTTAAELAELLGARCPGFTISWADEAPAKPPALLRYRDDAARAEWGWQPEHATPLQVIGSFRPGMLVASAS